MDAQATLDKLCARMREIYTLAEVCSVLHWDQETMMPKNGAATRAAQLSEIVGVLHTKRTHPQLQEWISALDQWALGIPATLMVSGKEMPVSSILGKRTAEKLWLVQSFSWTLRSFVESAKDRVESLTAEVFVRSLYLAALGREPSPDDLLYRIEELGSGKDRASLIDEVYSSAEANSRRLAEIDAHSIRTRKR